jgi:hypothetical protein
VNGDRFDDLTRLLARHTTRRQILTTALWGVVALLAAALRSGGIPAAARSSALTNQICAQQDQVSSAVPYCPSGPTYNPGTCPSPPGVTLWNGGTSLSCSSPGHAPWVQPRARRARGLDLLGGQSLPALIAG